MYLEISMFVMYLGISGLQLDHFKPVPQAEVWYR